MIDPNTITTVKVGDLPSADFNLTDNIPHEIGTELKQGTIQQLADLIANYIGTSSSLAFNPTTVASGSTLPATTTNEWILVGKGTFQNVGGGLNITTTEELNALTSNGTYWSLVVEIPIDVALAGITQNIRSNYTQTVPSEDAVFRALQDIINLIPSIPPITAPYIIDGVIGVTAGFVVGQQDFQIPVNGVVTDVILTHTKQYKATANNSSLVNLWSQTGTTLSITKVPALNNYIYIEYILP